MFRVAALIAALTGCGRISFGVSPDAGPDAAIDAPAVTPFDGPDSAALFDCQMSHPGALFCDGFEGRMDESWGYEVITNATVDATTTRAYRGTHAFEAHTAAINDYKYARWGRYGEAPIGSGDLYYRAFYWMPSTTVIDDQASFLTFGNGQPPYPSAYVMLSGGMIHVNVDSTSYLFPGDLPRDRWVCVELHINVSPTSGSFDLTFDGGTPMSASGIDTLVGDTGYTNLDVGVHYATPGQSPVDLWIDEVILDTSPIGCN